jgi:hypothetical protein
MIALKHTLGLGRKNFVCIGGDQQEFEKMLLDKI